MIPSPLTSSILDPGTTTLDHAPDRGVVTLAQRVVSVALAAASLTACFTFPVAGAALTVAMGVYYLLLVRYPLAWLIALPVLIPVLDLTPWSGRLYFNEFDFTILMSLAGALWHGLLRWPKGALSRASPAPYP